MKKLKLKAMLTLQTPNTASPWLFFKVWVAEHLETISIDLNNLLIKNIINSFDFITNTLNEMREDAIFLSPAIANKKLERFKKERKDFEEMELHISKSSNILLKKSISSLVKASYKYEARLHKIAFSDKPVIETPDYIKETLSNIGRISIKTNFESNNVF